MSDKPDLKQLAKDIHKGVVFSSWSIEPQPAFTEEEEKELRENWSGVLEPDEVDNLIQQKREDRLEQFARTLQLIFVPLMLMDEETHKKVTALKPVVYYARMADAGPRAINGYPMFMSVAFLDAAQAQEVLGHLKKLKEAEDAL